MVDNCEAYGTIVEVLGDRVELKFIDKKCIYYKQKIQGGDIITPIANSEELERMYVDAVRRDHTKQSINLANLYTLEKDYWIYPGEMIIIYGDTGMGKTAWVQN